MIQKLIQFLVRKPLLYVSSKLHSSPNRGAVFAKLSALLKAIETKQTTLGKIIDINNTDKFVIISDTHKGNGNDADDFKLAVPNYLEACEYYLQNNFTVIALGDIEELWENDIVSVIVAHEESIAAEKKFVEKGAFYKVVGNHDMYWKNTPKVAAKWLQKMYGLAVPIYYGLVLRYSVGNCNVKFFLTHGHQGDKTNDGSRISKWFVAHIWAPVQAYLNININTPSKDYYLRNQHNKMMYDWSATQKDTVLITGHTHKPVFASLTHVQQLQKDLQQAEYAKDEEKIKEIRKELYIKKQDEISVEKIVPKTGSYFNTGCGCYVDGDITLIEIAGGKIILKKWYTTAIGNRFNKTLQEVEINALQL